MYDSYITRMAITVSVVKATSMIVGERFAQKHHVKSIKLTVIFDYQTYDTK
jgi:hypothetical protein